MGQHLSVACKDREADTVSRNWARIRARETLFIMWSNDEFWVISNGILDCGSLQQWLKSKVLMEGSLFVIIGWSMAAEVGVDSVRKF